ncbi:MAG: hypothetical protein IKJ30_07065 [Bacilli bacterium]|nr:hypothetical protein [Bacilli bacterium]
MKKTMDIKDFTYLFLATLADNSKIINLRDKKIRTIHLPVNYKQIFENIMYAGNGWDEEFSIFIDTEEYFDDHFAWEEKFASALKETLIELEKPYKYDFVNDRLLIDMKQEQVDAILAKYPSEKLRNIMDHFTNLVVDFIYTREYAENYHDYSAITSAKIREINKNKIEDRIPQALKVKR